MTRCNAASPPHARGPASRGPAGQGDSPMTDLLALILLVGGLVLLDVLAIRFGYDSRDGFREDCTGH